MNDSSEVIIFYLFETPTGEGIWHNANGWNSSSRSDSGTMVRHAPAAPIARPLLHQVLVHANHIHGSLDAAFFKDWPRNWVTFNLMMNRDLGGCLARSDVPDWLTIKTAGTMVQWDGLTQEEHLRDIVDEAAILRQTEDEDDEDGEEEEVGDDEL